MFDNARFSLRFLVAALLATFATAAIGVATALAASGGPPFPR